MKLALPGSTGRQLALIVGGSISLAHILFAGIWMLTISLRGLAPHDRALAAQIGLVVRMDMTLPQEQRASAVAAASSPNLQISRVVRPPELGEAPNLLALVAAIRDEIAQPDIEVIGGAPTRQHDRPGQPPMRVAVHVSPTEWLTFGVTPLPHTVPLGAYNFPVAVILFLGLPMAAITVWAARRVTAPLGRLARATSRLSPTDSDQVIAEEGTDEVRQVASAFNALLARLRKFVADRTGMLAAISHDLRTPLTRLRLRVEMLADESVRGKMLKDIRAMDVMIASTLAYISQERSSEPLEQIDLAALLQTMCDDFSDAGFDVTYVGPLHCAIGCRPQALERALTNLIENATKFGESATLVLDAMSGALVIDVEDDGPGIADAEKEDVLKPFYRADAARGGDQGGVGLGLAIANTIVKGHGGSLELLDRQPHGLCVRVRIPRGG
jgi:signal transduction histidine kinase